MTLSHTATNNARRPSPALHHQSSTSYSPRSAVRRSTFTHVHHTQMRLTIALSRIPKHITANVPWKAAASQAHTENSSSRRRHKALSPIYSPRRSSPLVVTYQPQTSRRPRTMADPVGDEAARGMEPLDLEDKVRDRSDRSQGRRGGRGGKGGGRGGGGGGAQGRDVQVSRALSRLLRHQAANAGIKLDGEGFAPLDQVVSLCCCCRSCTGRRYAPCRDDEPLRVNP